MKNSNTDHILCWLFVFSSFHHFKISIKTMSNLIYYSLIGYQLTTYKIQAKIDEWTDVAVSGLRDAIFSQLSIDTNSLCRRTWEKNAIFIEKTTQMYETNESEMKILNGKSHLQSMLWIFIVKLNVSIRLSSRKKNENKNKTQWLCVLWMRIYIFLE